MHAVGRKTNRPPPEGWELIAPTLESLHQKMKEAQTASNEGQRRNQAVWPIFQIHNQRTRYIYELYYKRKAISQKLYNYCISEGLADGLLIAKWKKPGYENLCCLRCIQPKDTVFGSTCICRVPKSHHEETRIIECQHCGCRGCCG